MPTNKHGLTRNIPAEIKRAIRVKCGFGCVVCGVGIVHYEHVDPEFSDAQHHDPEAMTLLCPSHHDKVTRRFFSKESVKAAMAQPFSRLAGYSHEALDLSNTKRPEIRFSGMHLINVQHAVIVNGLPVLTVKEPEVPGGPFRLSAFFCNSEGKLSLRIVDNEWRAFDSNWDVEATAGSIVVRDGPRHISLKIDLYPPDSIAISVIDMRVFDWTIVGDHNNLMVSGLKNGNKISYGGKVINAYAGIVVGKYFDPAVNDEEY